MSPRPARRRPASLMKPPPGGSGVSVPTRGPSGTAGNSGAYRHPRDLMLEDVPPYTHPQIDGYRLTPTAIGWDVTLRHVWRDGTPLLSSHAGWAFTRAGAHRKARRAIDRERRRVARRSATEEYYA